MQWIPQTNPCASESILTSVVQKILFVATDLWVQICQEQYYMSVTLYGIVKCTFLKCTPLPQHLEIVLTFFCNINKACCLEDCLECQFRYHEFEANSQNTIIQKTHFVPFELLLFLVTDDHRLGSILLIDPNLFRCYIGTLILHSAKTLWNCRHHQMLKCLQWVTNREGRGFGKFFLNCLTELVPLIPANK